MEFFDPKGHAAGFYPIVKTMLSSLHLALEQYDDQAAWNLQAGLERCHQAGDTECGMHVIRFFAWRLHCKSLTDVHTPPFRTRQHISCGMSTSRKEDFLFKAQPAS